jgi:diguanylate cyclase (GGDEF)-like protein
LFLGIGFTFFIEYLKEPVQADSRVNIIDAETGAYNHPYFMLRLRQELSRSRHNNYAFSLALIKIYQRGLVHDVAQPIPPAKALRLILTYLDPHLREEDTLAYTGQNMFGVLLPHMPGEAATDLLSFLRSQISLISPNEIGENQATAICCSIGIAVSHLHTAPGEMLTQAVQALKEADTAVYGKVHLFTQTDSLTHHANGRSPIDKLSSEASR